MIDNSTRTSHAELSDDFHTEDMDIVASAKAFELLSTLYGDAIVAIIRELSTNAYDAHKIVGKEKVPFLMHLPNASEPWFSVIDEGVGLSKDEIFSVCKKYFASTKETSNDFVGTLGLGMKSPLAYEKGNGYSIIGCKDGMKSHVSIYITDEGFLPKTTLLLEEPTDEPNGVEVRMSVHRDDFSRFENSARKVLVPFEVKPTFIGGTVVDIIDYQLDDAFSTPDISVCKTSGHYYRSPHNSVVRMGNIDYPIDASMLYDFSRQLRSLIDDTSMIIHAPIGAVSFLPSRETLKYNQKTVTFIREKLEEYRDTILDEFKEKIDAIDDIWLRSIKIKSYSNNYGIKSLIANVYTDRYPGMVKKDCMMSVDFATILDGLDAIATSVSQHGTISSNLTETTLNYASLVVVDDSKFMLNTSLRRIKYNFKENKMFDNMPNYLPLRAGINIDWHLHHSCTVFLIHPNEPKDNKLTIDEIKARLDFPNIVYLSDLAALPSKKKPAQVTSLLGFIPSKETDLTEGKWRSLSKTAVQRIVEENELQKVYIPLSGYALSSELQPEYHNSKELINLCSTMGIIKSGKPVYGVRIKDRKLINKNDGWVNLEDLLVDFVSNISMEDSTALFLSAQSTSSIRYTIGRLHEQGKLSTTKDARIIGLSMTRYRNVHRHQVQDIIALVKRYAENTNIGKTLEKGEIEARRIQRKFGLLSAIESTASPDAVLTYIDAIEHHSKRRTKKKATA